MQFLLCRHLAETEQKKACDQQTLLENQVPTVTLQKGVHSFVNTATVAFKKQVFPEEWNKGLNEHYL